MIGSSLIHISELNKATLYTKNSLIMYLLLSLAAIYVIGKKSI